MLYSHPQRSKEELARMFEKILYEMRARVRVGRMAMSTHAIDEMHADWLTVDDLKQCLL